MKIALINTYPQGGAGIACRRLQKALLAQGHEVNLLTRDTAGKKWPFYAERLHFLPFEKDKSVRFAFSLANYGTDLSKHPVVQAADVIHLHWVNQGFLSLKNIQQLAALGKPICWTLHDMWAFTGGCHYSRGCRNFETNCGQCNYLRQPSANDLSYQIWSKKKTLFPTSLQIVTCSNWLAEEAKSSGLLQNFHIQTIPNPIDTAIFKPISPEERAKNRSRLGVSDKSKLLLFAAMKVSETRKGFAYLLESLNWLKEKRPDLPLELVVLGKADPVELAALPYPVHALGLIRDDQQLVQAYGMADVFVIPSLEDNLPNTVMEALACGTPVAGFETGGVPEMVKSGYNGKLAPLRDSKALALAVEQVVGSEENLEEMRINARQWVEKHYSPELVAEQYLKVYQNSTNSH